MRDPIEKITDYAYLAQGKSLGKKVDVFVNTDDSNLLIDPSSMNLFEIKGPDSAAMNLQLTMGPPRVIPVNGTTFTLAQAKARFEAQDASGTSDFASLEEATGDPYNSVSSTPLIGVLEWGVGGAEVSKVEVDFLNGLNVNLVASFLRMSVSADPLLKKTNTPAGDPALYELAAFVGPGFAKPNNAQRTIRFRTLSPVGAFQFGASPIVPIPKFATRVAMTVGCPAFVNPSTLVGWIGQIVFFSQYNGASGGYTPNQNPATWQSVIAAFTVADNGTGMKYCPIPNGAYYAAIINSNSYEIDPSLIFDLGI